MKMKIPFDSRNGADIRAHQTSHSTQGQPPTVSSSLKHYYEISGIFCQVSN